MVHNSQNLMIGTVTEVKSPCNSTTVKTKYTTIADHQGDTSPAIHVRSSSFNASLDAPPSATAFAAASLAAATLSLTRLPSSPSISMRTFLSTSAAPTTPSSLS
ncbi:hypothetical protein ACMD2_05370 [Ananas comosus]|uniref:Uncharacterized protein n=1 Tax=Ananas comosus TaxID=4615 RepID=A0A199VU67_ANACO|nr:hypothetical protein ACMD2_05370 [Ananas comosus]